MLKEQLLQKSGSILFVADHINSEALENHQASVYEQQKVIKQLTTSYQKRNEQIKDLNHKYEELQKKYALTLVQTKYCNNFAQTDDYESWLREKLINEIQKVKTIEELRKSIKTKKTDLAQQAKEKEVQNIINNYQKPVTKEVKKFYKNQAEMLDDMQRENRLLHSHNTLLCEQIFLKRDEIDVLQLKLMKLKGKNKSKAKSKNKNKQIFEEAKTENETNFTFKTRKEEKELKQKVYKSNKVIKINKSFTKQHEDQQEIKRTNSAKKDILNDLELVSDVSIDEEYLKTDLTFILQLLGLEVDQVANSDQFMQKNQLSSSQCDSIKQFISVLKNKKEIQEEIIQKHNKQTQCQHLVSFVDENTSPLQLTLLVEHIQQQTENEIEQFQHFESPKLEEIAAKPKLYQSQVFDQFEEPKRDIYCSTMLKPSFKAKQIKRIIGSNKWYRMPNSQFIQIDKDDKIQ